jgi:DNA-binding transcriptional LysR family regulator
MDRIEAMTLLLAVVEAGSFSAAGRQLGIPLATVSRKISDLEIHLKTQLLVRSAKKLDLTDAGRAYIVACKRILEDIAETERATTGEYSAPKGNLVIAAPIVFGRFHVLPIVGDFLKAHPEISVELLLSDRPVHLLEEHIDLAIRIGDLADSSLIGVRVGDVGPVICAAPDYLAAHGTPATPEALETHQCISFERLMTANGWMFSDVTKAKVPVKPRLRVTTAEAAVDAAIAGLGITQVMSYQVEDAVKSGKLAIILSSFQPRPWPITLIYSKQRAMPQKLRLFLDFAKPRLKVKFDDASA